MEKTTEKTDNRAVLAKALSELKRLQSRVRELEAERLPEAVAVVGMACRFPGGVATPEQLWRYLREGRNAVQEVPAARWNLDAFYDPEPGKAGKMYTRYGYFIEDVAAFDREFFNIGPAEADNMDPQHRLLLETVWEALEYAGLSAAELRGSNTGIFVGAMNSDYSHFSLQRPDSINMYTAITNGNGIAAGRLAHNFGFQGPAVAVDTLCSSSLVSVHMAMRSLQNRECDLALAGGINLMITPNMFIATCAANMLAADGLCKTFDDAADGYARGEGVGMIALKRLSDAERDGDTVLAVLRGSAVNQDGPSSALPVPNGRAQEKVIRAALADAGIEPGQVGYIEAHGTGTALGDPLEIEALHRVFGEGRTGDDPLYLGSIKTNYGHTEGAAGIAGLLKTILALRYGEIPPHVNFTTPSSKVAWDSLPVRVVTGPTPWPAGRPRCAGVSAFGIGGTNAHMVLEAAPPAAPAGTQQDQAFALTLSAKSGQALREMAGRFADYLGRDDAIPADSCYTANVSRSGLPIRLGLYGESREQLVGQLRAVYQDTAPLTAEPTDKSPSRLAFLFSGQGSQYAGMGQSLYRTQPAFRDAIDQCEALLREHLDVALTSLLWGDDSDKLNLTQYTQPALFALEYALAEMWNAWGVKPHLVMGHSVGEYAAACYAGLFSLKDGLRLISARGRLMSTLCEAGAMSVWFCPAAVVKGLLQDLNLGDRLCIAAMNAPENTTVSGTIEAMAEALAEAQKRGIAYRPLEVSHAFHSSLLEPMLDAFRQVADSVQYKKPRLRIVSNVTGQPAGEELGNALYWVRHTRSPVKFQNGLQALAANRVGTFLEIGPGTGLLSIGKSCLSDASLAWLPSLHAKHKDKAQYLETAAALWQRGASIDWKALHKDRPYRKVALPFYPFQRRRHWLATAEVEAVAVTAPALPKPADTVPAPANTARSVPERVLSIVSTVGGIPVEDIKPEHNFLADLGYDSMMIMELKTKLETAFAEQDKIPIRDILTVTTVHKLIEFTEQRMAS
ncbi:MAG: type I polyketide synthase [Gammaproteobacteria bacterium]